MAKKKAKAGAKVKGSSKSSKSSGSSGLIAKGKALLSGSKGSGKGGRRKKSALWYAKEIQRIKLKRKYERIKYAVR